MATAFSPIVSALGPVIGEEVMAAGAVVFPAAVGAGVSSTSIILSVTPAVVGEAVGNADVTGEGVDGTGANRRCSYQITFPEVQTAVMAS